ncbi:phytanoyl-CoA dioxygenase [Polaribacter staleyi]|uniref:phytanoyl-CoA dioxygenase n=1 Tax=Polaribacter staleyi TaxID=2022337 RepID=UPI0031BAFF4F
MTKNKTVNHLKKLVTSLLEAPENKVKVESILNEIHTHFKEITKITGFDIKIEHLAAVPTAKGKALGLNHAAQCLLDYKRTVKFLQGVFLAIKEKQKLQPGKTITFFYAGCGPYAPFVTLIAPFFSAEEVQFTLLEINKNSLEAAKKLINYLELNNHIKDYYLADAVTFVVPNATKFDILFSETLDALLYRECYVPILFNLLPQFSNNVTLIPENVILNLKLIYNSDVKESDKEQNIDTILDVRKTISAHKKEENTPLHLPDKKVDLTSLSINQNASFLLETQVLVYKNIWLNRNESSLTLPLEIKLDYPISKSQIIFTYNMGPEIELKCKLV